MLHQHRGQSQSVPYSCLYSGRMHDGVQVNCSTSIICAINSQKGRKGLCNKPKLLQSGKRLCDVHSTQNLACGTFLVFTRHILQSCANSMFEAFEGDTESFCNHHTLAHAAAK